MEPFQSFCCSLSNCVTESVYNFLFQSPIYVIFHFLLPLPTLSVIAYKILDDLIIKRVVAH